jgi:hypothetical protein
VETALWVLVIALALVTSLWLFPVAACVLQLLERVQGRRGSRLRRWLKTPEVDRNMLAWATVVLFCMWAAVALIVGVFLQP